jgi:hypothetical protein
MWLLIACSNSPIDVDVTKKPTVSNEAVNVVSTTPTIHTTTSTCWDGDLQSQASETDMLVLCDGVFYDLEVDHDLTISGHADTVLSGYIRVTDATLKLMNLKAYNTEIVAQDSNLLLNHVEVTWQSNPTILIDSQGLLVDTIYTNNYLPETSVIELTNSDLYIIHGAIYDNVSQDAWGAIQLWEGSYLEARSVYWNTGNVVYAPDRNREWDVLFDRKTNNGFRFNRLWTHFWCQSEGTYCSSF